MHHPWQFAPGPPHPVATSISSSAQRSSGGQWLLDEDIAPGRARRGLVGSPQPRTCHDCNAAVVASARRQRMASMPPRTGMLRSITMTSGLTSTPRTRQPDRSHDATVPPRRLSCTRRHLRVLAIVDDEARASGARAGAPGPLSGGPGSGDGNCGACRRGGAAARAWGHSHDECSRIERCTAMVKPPGTTRSLRNPRAGLHPGYARCGTRGESVGSQRSDRASRLTGPAPK